MRASHIGLVVLALFCVTLIYLVACGSSISSSFADGGASSGGPFGGFPDGGGFTLLPDGGFAANGSDAGQSYPTQAIGTVQSPDCAGCTFPPPNAPACSGTAPPITVVYPTDGVVVPPNMGLISVQWKPNGSPYTRFEVDFESGQNTDWRIITSCGTSTQTTDMQTTPAAASGGCDLPIQGASWSYLSGTNRGGNPVTVTVRGTTDGNCATVSSNNISLSFASEDLLGTYYYWKSTVSANGTGGQIWSKLFGAPATAEVNVTSSVATANRQTLNATCNGCHALSRDGSRMVVYSDDDDSDDEYSDIGGSLLNLTATPATEIGVGVTGMRAGGQPPGFTAMGPTANLYLTSNGIPLPNAGAPGGVSTSAGYTAAVGANAVSLWNAMGQLVGPVTLGGARPTMPDWSIDGTTVVYVQPQAVAHWDPNGGTGFTGSRDDDAHIFGGSLYTVPYQGNGAFGTPAVFLQSGGENNYYPSFSPDATSSAPPSYIIFDRAPLDMSAGSVEGCRTGTAPMCPNDSFSNPAARLMLANARTPGGTPVDLEKANGTTAASPMPWSNSYPRWAPFVQTYKGNKILWFTFSSTRDYGLRVLNHKMGMYQCYPADAAQTPGGAHGGKFAPQCQEPQLWMAPIAFSENAGTKDPSFPAFWLPYQDMTTHNHTAQWTQQVGPPSQPMGCTCSMVGGACGAVNACGCCDPTTTPRGPSGLVCSGSNVCIAPAM